MPYIKTEDRVKLISKNPENAGELNYKITELIDIFIQDKGLSYSVLNEAMGALECAKLELYRRIAAPYEDTKIDQNGEVYLYSINFL